MSDDDFDRTVDQAIIRKVRGEDSWWEIDRRYPAKGRTWEERFTKDGNGRAPGDKQVLLWVVDLYAEKNLFPNGRRMHCARFC
jgi:hypothetical protein